MMPEVVSSLESMIAKSALLDQLAQTYSWPDPVRATYVQGILSTLTDPRHWRVAELLRLNQVYNLKLDAGRGGRVLDAGSGSGGLTIAARARGFDIVGLDADAASLDLARRLARASGLTENNDDPLFVEADLARSPFPREHFALITSHVVIEHVADMAAVLAELVRCLRPGGILWLVGPDYRFPCEPHYKLPWLPFMSKHVAPAWLEMFGKSPGGLATFNYISLPQCRAVLESLGLETLDARTTTPEARIREELTELLGDAAGDYLQSDPDEVRKLALSARHRGITTSETAFIILAQKPGDRLFPA